jgi:hypothetical protein
VTCSTDTGRFNVCRVYTKKGDFIYEDTFTLEGLDRGATKSELRYRFLSGDKILLQEGLALVSVSPGKAPSHSSPPAVR